MKLKGLLEQGERIESAPPMRMDRNMIPTEEERERMREMLMPIRRQFSI